MKSKVSIKGHPIHAMLIVFPVAFLLGAFGFDLCGWLFSDLDLHHSAFVLASLGVAMGVLAGVFGMIDYIFIVPPNSSAKDRATFHMSANVVALLLFFSAMV